MGDHWTKKERREYLFEKYYRRRDKAFTILLLFVFVLGFLAVIFRGGGLFTPARELSALILVILVIVFFITAYRGEHPQLRFFALLALVLLAIFSLLAWDVLTGFLQVIALAALVILFIALLFVAAFFADLVVYENY